MKANEFVKKFGWGEAKTCLLNCVMPQDKWFMYRGNLIAGQDFDDLKRLVESYKLVESLGGLKASLYLRNHNMLTKEHSPRVKQAIADFESCL